MNRSLQWVNSLVSRKMPNALKLRVKVLLQHAALYIGRRPKLKRVAMQVLHRFPNIRMRLAQTILPTTSQLSWLEAAQHNLKVDVALLTPHARQIYTDLKVAIERRTEEGN